MKTLRFLTKYIPKYLVPLGATVVSMVLLVGVQLLVPLIVRSMIGIVTDPSQGWDSALLITRLALLAPLVARFRLSWLS